ncbi:MAG TPA: hypothetical protein VE843_13140 [Ktedonobacteraceae bacterium]|nr:hypothetical protein [Ktedonobacteraceae bacterium]
MSQTQKDNPTQTPTERAEELFNHMGQRVGYLATLASQRLQTVATSIREEADRLDEPQSVSGEHSNGSPAGPTGESYQQATAKAEQLVDQWGQRISHYTAIAGLQFRRVVARAREEAEDIWAEAQNIRRQDDREPL